MASVSMDKAREMESNSMISSDLKLYVRDVRDRFRRKRAITVRSWSTIKDVKQVIHKVFHVPVSVQKLYYGPLLTSGKQLPNHRTLRDAGIECSGETLLLDIQSTSLSHDDISHASSSSSSRHNSSCYPMRLPNDVYISSSVVDFCPRLLRQLVAHARRGLAVGLKPEFVLDGSGGTYFLHDVRKIKIAVFKPADEEPYAPNNPRGYLPQPGQPVSLRDGLPPGEACIREIAAFMLDHGGFSSVPMTTLAEARHPAFNTNGSRLKVSEGGAAIGSHSISSVDNVASAASDQYKKVGSFQEFVRAECTMDDLSPSKIPVDEVHKIAILDIRILNADRNAANLLCRRKRDNSLQLIPIDHGFCLRSNCDVSWMDWCWLDWPQLKEPLSKASRDYVLSLDVEADVKILRERLSICQEALDYFRASCGILKAGVQAGLTLYEIACMCCRNDDLGEVPSKLEVLFSIASEVSERAVRNGRWKHETISRALTQQLTPVGGSLIKASSSSQSSQSLRKSHSAVQIASFRAGLDQPPLQDLPEMIKSTASDTSSDDDECDEWAASMVADVSLDKSLSLMVSKERSVSIESDSSEESGLSQSPKGFWHVRPGSAAGDLSDDEGSIHWSPNSSPVTSTLSPNLSPIRMQDRRSSVVAGLVGMGREDDSGGGGTSSPVPSKKQAAHHVSFAETKTEVDPPPAALFSQQPAFMSSFDFAPSMLQPVPRLENGLPRSKSFSALTAAGNRDAEKQGSERLHRQSDQYRQYRDYFLKFVDLVVTHEIAAASRHHKPGTSG